MEELIQEQEKPVYNTKLLQEYLTHLKSRYKQLEEEPFSTKARIKLNQEIENITMLLEEKQMEKAWENLNTIFNSSSSKPDFRKETSEFREMMAGKKTDEWVE